jgi:hypothetical protein
VRAIFINCKTGGVSQNVVSYLPPDLTNLLLLHELRVGAVIDNIFAENGGCQDGVDVFGAHVADLAVQDEVVALGADVNGGLLSEQNEGEAVAVLREKEALDEQWQALQTNGGAHLLSVLLEEAGRVHAVGDGAAHEGEPVEDERGLIGVLEERLVQNVEEDA